MRRFSRSWARPRASLAKYGDTRTESADVFLMSVVMIPRGFWSIVYAVMTLSGNCGSNDGLSHLSYSY